MSTTFIERFRLSSLILNAILIPICILLFILLLKKEPFDCDSCFEKAVIIKHDTIYPKDILKPVIVKVPEVFKAIAKKDLLQKGEKSTFKLLPVEGIVTIKNRSEVDQGADSEAGNQEASASHSACDTINYYSDTMYLKDSYRAVVNDTVEGKILGRSFWFVNLTPEIKTTIEKRLKEKWKFYIGGAFTINQKNMDRWGVGPSALLTIPKVGGIGYYFDAKNFAHTGSFYALIRFKK